VDYAFTRYKSNLIKGNVGIVVPQAQNCKPAQLFHLSNITNIRDLKKNMSRDDTNQD
jgi:hypothetical protein